MGGNHTGVIGSHREHRSPKRVWSPGGLASGTCPRPGPSAPCSATALPSSPPSPGSPQFPSLSQMIHSTLHNKLKATEYQFTQFSGPIPPNISTYTCVPSALLSVVREEDTALLLKSNYRLWAWTCPSGQLLAHISHFFTGSPPAANRELPPL